MTAADTWLYSYLPPAVIPGSPVAVAQVKVGKGQLKSWWVQDDNGSGFCQIYDGIVNPVVGQPLTPQGRILFSTQGGLMEGSFGPTCITFTQGLIVVYSSNSPQTSGFVAFR